MSSWSQSQMFFPLRPGTFTLNMYVRIITTRRASITKHPTKMANTSKGFFTFCHHERRRPTISAPLCIFTFRGKRSRKSFHCLSPKPDIRIKDTLLNQRHTSLYGEYTEGGNFSSYALAFFQFPMVY